MEITPRMLWAFSIALLRVPGLLAQPTATTTTSGSPTTTSAAPSCTASLITKLCSYPEPGPEFAVASSGNGSCWDYCNDHQPCNFVIFAAGNPHLGTGTCWLYPGESFDASAGTSEGCSNPYLSVYDKPACDGEDGGTPTTSSGACAATATPSAVASVCGYPPPKDCFHDCTASESASACLSQCAKADACSYVVFNPHNGSNSPHASGTCWMYADGKYDDEASTTCGSGGPEQYVYRNVCPKPSPASSSSSSHSSTTEPADGSATGPDTAEAEDDEDAASALSALSLTNVLAIAMAMLL